MEILAFYGLQLTIALIISDCFFVFRFRLVHNMLHITEKSQLPSIHWNIFKQPALSDKLKNIQFTEKNNRCLAFSFIKT